MDVQANKKYVAFQMNEEMSNALKYNIQEYIEDHVSLSTRLMGEEDQHTDGRGNLDITGDQVQPLCYAIASNKTFIKKYGTGWTVDVYNASGDFIYRYRDDKFLKKPELELDPVIQKAQEEHDDNVAEIATAVINAIGRSSN